MRPQQAAWAPVPGPLDRTSFFAELARHRRATWRMALLCVAAVLLMGVVVSLIITPLLVMQFGFAVGVFGFVLPIPETLKALPKGYLDLIEPLMHQDQRPATFQQIVTGWTLLLLPGIALMTAICLWLRALFSRAGVGGALLALGAREPSPTDFEERQLVNVVAEMAIAAGLSAPKVVLLDSAVPNLAAVGTGPDDATVVVSRRLLDEFDRDQTQAALAHVVGSIGNGDLRIAFAIVSVYQTFGLLMTLLDLPFSAAARTTVARTLHLALRRPAGKDADEADKVTALFSEAFQSRRLDEIGQFIEPDPSSFMGRLDRRTVVFRGIRIAAFAPLLFANLFGKLVLIVLLPLLLGPLIALLWGTRRYMADSTAVKLTRNPDGMARALTALWETGGLPPGSRWSAHLFMVGTEVAQDQAQRRMLLALKNIGPAQAARPLPEQISARIGMMQAMRYADEANDETKSAKAETFAESNFIFMNFHPKMRKRLARLSAQGGNAGA